MESLSVRASFTSNEAWSVTILLGSVISERFSHCPTCPPGQPAICEFWSKGKPAFVYSNAAVAVGLKPEEIQDGVLDARLDVLTLLAADLSPHVELVGGCEGEIAAHGGLIDVAALQARLEARDVAVAVQVGEREL